MMTLVTTLAVILLLLYLFRLWLMNLQLPARDSTTFAGALYETQETVIAVRERSADARQTIICFPGFLEDMRYFQALYEDTPAQLIICNNAGSHSPFSLAQVQPLDWPRNPYMTGTIEYDGFVLAQVVQHLADGDQLTLHGHSRGGAVVLEAARQFPELMLSKDREVRAILEAAVVPGGTVAGGLSGPIMHRVALFLMPMVLYASRWANTSLILRQPVMRPTNALKIELYMAMFWTLKNYRTCVASAYSIWHWQQLHNADLFQNYRSVVVLQGERDDVLDNQSMAASAERGRRLNPGVRIVKTQNTNHMISLEHPELVRRHTYAAG